MVGNTEVPLSKELVGVIVEAELLKAGPNHSELFDSGRCQEGQGTHGEEDKCCFQKEAEEEKKQNGLRLKHSFDCLVESSC